MALITILTDFGLKDPYVGIMKGVILSINPEARIIDITHEISPQAIEEAAFVIEEYASFFPSGTVHLCVVDPSVGSERKPIIVERGGSFFVGPDNGIFSLLFDGKEKVYEIENRAFMLKHISSTFHGRDIFAPCCAYLSLGVKAESFGQIVFDPIKLDLLPKDRGSVLEGSIIRFDRFGNAITNIHLSFLQRFVKKGPFKIRLRDLLFTSLQKSYFEQEISCLIGSSGYIEFGIFKGSFKERFDLKKGEPVFVEKGPEP